MDVSATVGRLSPRADMDGETYEQWVTGYAINSGKGQGKAAQRRQAVRALAPDVSSARCLRFRCQFSSTGPKARDRVGDRIFHPSVPTPEFPVDPLTDLQLGVVRLHETANPT